MDEKFELKFWRDPPKEGKNPIPEPSICHKHFFKLNLPLLSRLFDNTSHRIAKESQIIDSLSLTSVAPPAYRGRFAFYPYLVAPGHDPDSHPTFTLPHCGNSINIKTRQPPPSLTIHAPIQRYPQRPTHSLWYHQRRDKTSNFVRSSTRTAIRKDHVYSAFLSVRVELRICVYGSKKCCTRRPLNDTRL